MTTLVSSFVAAKAMRAALILRQPLLFVGAPGIGKTDLVEAVAAEQKHDIILTHPGTQDPTDPKGLPWPDAKKGIANFLPFGDLKRALEARKPTIWFLDDFGQANASVQAPYMQLLLARRIGDHVLPDCITFIAATNRRSDRAGVSGLLEPIKSRFCSIIHMGAELEAWLTWAYANGVHPMVTAFLRMRREMLHVFEPSNELVNYPCPRTWVNVSNALNKNLLDEDLRFAFTEGSVGTAGATEFIGFLNVCKDIPMPEEIFISPATARIPDNVSTQYALCAALASMASVQNFDALVVYAKRLLDKGHGEIAAYLLQDACKRTPKLTQTAAFVEMTTGPMSTMLN